MPCGMQHRLARNGISSFRRLWRNLKRKLLFDGPPTNSLHGFTGNNNSNIQAVSNAKRSRLDIVTKGQTESEERSFMEMMRSLLSCSVCMDISSQSNQCKNGHLICESCTLQLQQNLGEISCPVCRISLKGSIQRSLLAEQLASELPANCRYCKLTMTVRKLKVHEKSQCSLRTVFCKYTLFGCPWKGKAKDREEHLCCCSMADATVSDLSDIVEENIQHQLNALEKPVIMWKAVIGKLREKTEGVKFIVKQTALNRVKDNSWNNSVTSVYKSPSIRLPFSCCIDNNLMLSLTIRVNKDPFTNAETLQYNIVSENRFKSPLSFFINTIRYEDKVLEVQDQLRTHLFDTARKDSGFSEIYVTADDNEISTASLWNKDSLFVELCFFGEKDKPVLTGEGEDNNMFSSIANNTRSGNQGNSGQSNVVVALISPQDASGQLNNASAVGEEENAEDEEEEEDDDEDDEEEDNLDVHNQSNNSSLESYSVADDMHGLPHSLKSRTKTHDFKAEPRKKMKLKESVNKMEMNREEDANSNNTNTRCDIYLRKLRSDQNK